MLYEAAVSTGLPISLDAAKRALRVDFSDDDAEIEALIASEIRRYEEFTRRVIRRASWIAGFPMWLSSMRIRLDAVRAITGIRYSAEDGASHDLSEGSWSAEYFRNWGVNLQLSADLSLPQLADVPCPIRVAMEAGADDDGASPVVMPINEADQRNILHLVKQIYDHEAPLTDEQMRERFASRRILW